MNTSSNVSNKTDHVERANHTAKNSGMIVVNNEERHKKEHRLADAYNSYKAISLNQSNFVFVWLNDEPQLSLSLGCLG